MVRKLLKSFLGVSHGTASRSSEAALLLEAICEEGVSRFASWEDKASLARLEAWRALKKRSDELQIQVALLALRRCNAVETRRFGYSRYTKTEFAKMVAAQLLRARLPFQEQDVAAMAWIAARQSQLEYRFPTLSVIGLIERHCEGKRPSGALRRAIQAFRVRVRGGRLPFGPSQASRKFLARLDALLEPTPPGSARSLPKGAWGERVKEWLDASDGSAEQDWHELLAHASTAGDKSKPNRKWIADAQAKISAVGAEAVTDRLIAWLDETRPHPVNYDASLEALKGLVWMAVHLPHEDVAFAVGRFAGVCFTKVPGVGARSQKLGNACLLTLGAMAPAEGAVSELVRLKRKIKYASTREAIEKRLEEAADRCGESVDDLEQRSLPDFGLALSGETVVRYGEVAASVKLDAEGVSLGWIGSDGKPRKSVPVAARRDHGPDVADLKRLVRDASTALSGQTAYLEASYLEDRSMPVDVWEERFLRHPLRRALAHALVWHVEHVEHDAAPMTVLPVDGVPHSLSGDEVALPKNAIVRLWHPLMSDANQVLAWRSALQDRGIVQPFKQAHREVYALTDAERQTRVYSNRFAAHILRQHQLRALCQARGWLYDLQGAWDSWNLPTRNLGRIGLAAEFHVEALLNDDLSETYVALYLSSDQVRFMATDGAQLELVDVPPLVFSEIMRDVDLFVAVTSVANDPSWSDGGPEGRFRDYWHEHAFGELGETAATRRAVLQNVVPQLAISDRLKVTDKFLEVRGNRHNYQIHLGSGNIMILPANRYLCIVRAPPDRNARQVRLPFAGDAVLSTILSKAFLLAADDKIRDETILSQL